MKKAAKNAAIQVGKFVMDKSWHMSKKEEYEKGLYRPENCFTSSKEIALCHAVIKKDINAMERLIANGADVNAVGKAKLPHQKYVEPNGEVITITEQREIPLLGYALPFGENVLECLLKHGADPNVYMEDAGIAQKKLLLCEAVEYVSSSLPEFENYVKLLLKYGADPEREGEYPLIQAAGTKDIDSFADSKKVFPALVTLVEAGCDLNRGNGGKKYYAVTAAQSHCYNLLYLLKSGAAYDPQTIPGGELHRILYERAEKRKKLTPEQRQRAAEPPDGFDEVIAWLEQRGVSFDKPLPPGTIKPEPFRVNNKLLEMRKKKAAKPGD